MNLADLLVNRALPLFVHPPGAVDVAVRRSLELGCVGFEGCALNGKPNCFRPRRRQVATAARELLDSLVTNAPPRYREVEAAKVRARAVDRFHSSDTRRSI